VALAAAAALTQIGKGNKEQGTKNIIYYYFFSLLLLHLLIF